MRIALASSGALMAGVVREKAREMAFMGEKVDVLREPAKFHVSACYLCCGLPVTGTSDKSLWPSWTAFLSFSVLKTFCEVYARVLEFQMKARSGAPVMPIAAALWMVKIGATSSLIHVKTEDQELSCPVGTTVLTLAEVVSKSSVQEKWTVQLFISSCEKACC